MLRLERVPREALLLLAVVDLCLALTYRQGTYGRIPFALVLVAVVLTALAIALDDHPTPRWVWGVAAAACALTEVYQARYWPAWALSVVIVSALSVGLAMAVRRRSSVIVLVLIAIGATLTMASIEWTWGRSQLDVFNAVQNASDAVLHGHNPYSATFQNFVPTSARSVVWRTAHYPYGPTVPILAAPARLLGDIRLGSVAGFALLFAFTVRLAAQAPDGGLRRWRTLPLCLATPLTVGMIDSGWIDVYMVAGYAGWLAFRHTHPRWAVVCLATSLTVKPTILVALLLPALWSHRARIETAVASGLAAATFVPFAIITGIRPFGADLMNAVVTNGPRADGIGLKAYWYWTVGYPFPSWLSTLLAAGIILAVACRRPRTYSDMLGASALIMTTSLLLASWAFYNYYFVPVWLLCLALAGSSSPFGDASDNRLPRLLSSHVQRAPRKLGSRMPVPVPVVRSQQSPQESGWRAEPPNPHQGRETTARA